MAFAGAGELARYARMKNPRRELLSTILLTYDEKTISVFDLYPKAKYHFLILPRETEESPALTSLSTLLSQGSSVEILETLSSLRVASEEVVEMIHDEQMKTEGFEWPVHVGFHAVPSMRHVHLHVISDDLVSPSLKIKKHYNSFHPDLGFFLHLDEISKLVEGGGRALRFPPSHYENLLKSELRCHHCGTTYRTMPALKEHLEQEYEERKRKSVTT